MTDLDDNQSPQLLPVSRPIVALPIPRVPRTSHLQVSRIQGRAVEGGACINGAAFVTHTALTLVGRFTAEEGRLVSQNPLAEPRYAAIVNTFVGVCCSEIARQR